MSEWLLEMRRIRKSFARVQVLKDVDLQLRKGEIVSLLGENGAGKSTLMKVLTGVHTEFEGDIVLDGKPVRFKNTKEAFAQGISIVFQEFNLCIMDEPTSALTGEETRNLFVIMRELRARGIAIVFISHKLDEVMTITDRVVCMKDGENSGEIATCEATEDKLVAMMVGRKLDHLYGQRHGQRTDDVVLEVRDLSGPPRIRNVSFKLRKGEIIGLAGLLGAGRTELALLLMGVKKKTSGTLLFNGRKTAINHPSGAVSHHMGYASEDRKRFGLVLPMTVRENITMTIHSAILDRLGLISAAKEKVVTDRYIDMLDIKVSSREQITRNLSGGNQQKVVIAKWLAIQPLVLILDEPTRGIDVGAKAEVHKIIADLADKGVAVIVISSELPEVLRLADRILVMHEGRVTADLLRGEATEQSIMKAAVS